ncbi:hypothetical protein [Streptomyces sp. ITFR-16]|uniref:hypothetical protein n=1 Tax=Streptomyces sp. ITFR-16 TaxID=3075198 RepID=UPI0028898284|nr:hypothetical protein [Streptomyces sp. ITFR-16]WNI27297.1 hypothetical protein RLT58_35765 [Streptomyces sp. ITFR-16]
MSVAFRIRCCLCTKNIPLAGDVIALDGEWQRRYPNMRGTLACERCVIDYGWNCCTTTQGGFVDGHVAAPEGEVDVDSWSHHLERGTHRALVTLYPRSGLLQGAEPYLRSLANRRGTLPEVAARLGAALDGFDAQHSRTGTPQPVTG